MYINVYIPTNKSSNYIKQILTELKGEIDISKVMVGESNITLSVINRTTSLPPKKNPARVQKT